jgi:rare lipoprotein A (peptidoglycan hydrolase)
MIRARPREIGLTRELHTNLQRRLRQYFALTLLGVASLFSGAIGEGRACSANSGQTGVASYYGPGLQGNRTANGDVFDMWAMTAAHSCLPLGTRVRVTVLETGRSMIVLVNDRLPTRGRVLDLSMGAARALGIVSQGIARVQLTPL